MNGQYHVHIDSEKRASLNLKELSGYRDLIVLMAKRDFALRYKQTVLGPLWLVINPVLTSLIYMLIFTGVAGIGTDGIPPILFYLLSTSMWTVLSTVLNQTSNTFLTNAYVFGKVYFPRLTVPLSYVLVAFTEFIIRFFVIILFMIFFINKGTLAVTLSGWILLIPVTLLAGALGLGIGLAVSALTTRYRDLRILVGFAVTLWMYASAVVYPLSQITDPKIMRIMKLNPAATLMELTRKAVFGTGTADIKSVAVLVTATFLMLIIGMLLFSRSERDFLDTV